MYYIELIPGSSSEFFLFNLIDGTIVRKTKKDNIDEKELYGFNLYKLYNFFGQNIPYIKDLQSLNGLQLNKIDSVEELFEKDISEGFERCKQKINAYIKSFTVCKIPTSNFTIEQLVPEQVLEKYYQQKLMCVKNTIQNKTFDKSVIDFYESKFQELKSIVDLSKNNIIINNEKSKLSYQIFGSKNSRLSIKKNNFNIFNIPKEKRDCIKAPPGFTLCQIDFKSFQPRLALSIFGDESIKQKLRENDDIYSLFDGDREVNKIELISWMFSNRKNEKFDTSLSFIKKSRAILHEQSKSGMLLNFFNRPLFFGHEEENVVFQNYICSVEADCIISLIKDTQIELKNSKSYLAFPFHDCLIFCISDDEFEQINHLKWFIEKYLYNSFYVNFPVSIKVGKSFGILKDFT